MSGLPYHLSEEDHFRLYKVRDSLRLLQFLAEEAHSQAPFDPQLLASYLAIMGEQLCQVLEAAERSGRRRARA